MIKLIHHQIKEYHITNVYFVTIKYTVILILIPTKEEYAPHARLTDIY